MISSLRSLWTIRMLELLLLHVVISFPSLHQSVNENVPVTCSFAAAYTANSMPPSTLTSKSSLTTSNSNSNSNPSSSPPSSSSEINIPWLIVGGGIHGVHIATRLIDDSNGNGNGNNNKIVIVDDNHELLHKWKSRTAATGMTYLRSSIGYHLDIDEHSLRRHLGGGNIGLGKQKIKMKKKRNRNQNKFKKQKQKQKQVKQEENGKDKDKKDTTAMASFTKDYERPRLDLFNQHCDSVIAKYGLENLHVRGIVTNMEPMEDHVRVKVVVTTTSTGVDPYSCTDNNDEHEAEVMIYRAERVVLALGNDAPSYADWVEEKDVTMGRVRHLLDTNTSTSTSTSTGTATDDDNDTHMNNNRGDANNDELFMHNHHHHQSIAVIGGGITAAHKALELVAKNKHKVNGKHSVSSSSSSPSSSPSIHLISRHALREQQFDTHQDWMMDRRASERSERNGGYGMPSRQRKFAASACWEERRRTILRERIPGTVTPAVHRGENGLRYAIERGDVQFHQAEVMQKRYFDSPRSVSVDNNGEECEGDGDGNVEGDESMERMELTLSTGEKVVVDEVILATGFGKNLPGGSLIRNDLVKGAGLEVSDFCGFPIVDEDLRWHPRIFVAGALAELELGPSARNIAGARMAAERIVQATHS